LSYILLLLGGAGEWPARLDVRTNSDTLRDRDSSVSLPRGQSSALTDEFGQRDISLLM
jgi:hypothetical protein